MDTGDLRATAAECASYLRASTSADWTVPIHGMPWTVGQAVAHICDGLLWHATDFVAGTAELSTMDLAVRPSTPPSDLVRTLETFAEVLARALDGAAPGDRGLHSAGLPDPSGFAGMACDELLVHTMDAAAGLGRTTHRRPTTHRSEPRRRFTGRGTAVMGSSSTGRGVRGARNHGSAAHRIHRAVRGQRRLAAVG
jgi:hypothetical protein